MQVIVPIGYSVIGAFLASRRPRNPTGWIFLSIAFLAGLQGVTQQYVFRSFYIHRLPLVTWVALSHDSISWVTFPCGLVVLFFLLFPDGHFQSRRWRSLAWIAGTVFWVGLAGNILEKTVKLTGLPAVKSPLGAAAIVDPNGSFSLVWLAGFAILFISMVGTILRTQRSTGELHQQLRWLRYGTAVAFVGVAIVILFGWFIFPTSSPVWQDAVYALAFGVALPVSCGIAILKYGLYELDVVINKTLVFGLLAAFFTAVYVIVVVGFGAAFGSRHNEFLTLAASALIAIAFNPVRERATRLADHIVYGKRATPYEVLAEFSERMSGTYALDDILPRMARVLAEGTGGCAEIWLRVGAVLRRVAIWPSQEGPETSPNELAVVADDLPAFAGAPAVVPVLHQGNLLGAITVAKAPNDPLRPTEDKLIEHVASQAGLVLNNVRLIEELRASRQRLVKAQDEERRRIERNIHDGAQQQLVSLAVKLNLVDLVFDTDGPRGHEMLAELKVEAHDALQDLRDLAHGIYPPLLADKGLGVALDAQARKSPIPVVVESDGIGRYPQEIEAAVYFCCLEALQNVAKYAKASEATVRLSNGSDLLTFEVVDDGAGFDSDSTGYGTGLQGMSDRLEALGGSLAVRSSAEAGTTVVGRVPGHLSQN